MLAGIILNEQINEFKCVAVMKIAACVEYDGSRFYGWQIQTKQFTVQEAIEKALSAVADHKISVHCAGRTDTGVHACGQIIHFETQSHRDEYSWVMGANSSLPAGISLLWTREVDDSFHARFSAMKRRYRYVILNRRVRPANLSRQVSWHPLPLDAQEMDNAAQSLIGTHDFSAFRSSRCQSKSPRKTVTKLRVNQKNNWIWIDIEANGFLHHMVRNIAGSLMEVGSGKRDPSWLQEVLKSRDRTQGAATASALGLYFLKAEYPSCYKLPNTPRPIRFW